MKDKVFSIWAKATDSSGQAHYVTVVGIFSKRREGNVVEENVYLDDFNTEGTLKYNFKKLRRRLTVGMSICHPEDRFDEQVGIDVAVKRIAKGEFIGQLETSHATMLTKDAIMAEILVKLNHICQNIDKYLPN